MIKDTTQRSLVKAFSWRLIGSLDTFFISLIVTGKALIAAPIAVSEVMTKIILYFFHERIWNIIPWGRNQLKSSPIRSLVKSISWRTLGTIDTIILSYFFTGNIYHAFSIGGIELFTKIALYFIHERVWAQIKWGRIKESYAVRK